jgi:hypothetical protein
MTDGKIMESARFGLSALTIHSLHHPRQQTWLTIGKK